jgi:hypothetical protein
MFISLVVAFGGWLIIEEVCGASLKSSTLSKFLLVAEFVDD